MNLLETSLSVKLLKNAYRKYCGLKRWLDEVYKNSSLYRIIKSFWGNVVIAFQYSFLGRITEVGDLEGNSEILDNSKVVKRVLTFYNNWKIRLLNYSNTSKVIYSTIEIRKELYLFPAKTGGAIVFTAVLTNMVLSLLMHKEISLFGWGMRWVLLVVGFLGMFCKVGWEEFKRTSWLMKHVEKQRLLRPPQADSQ